ncbi:MAG: nucleotidyltransferase family protein [Flavihumibacter sp.]|nr:nucleotidyltransferase family protein [Flavihumibacter sp.]
MLYNIQQPGIVLLAAGQSKRLGHPKQLLSYNGTTLIEHAVNAALATTLTPVIVVLGACNEIIAPYLTPYTRVHVVYNKDWETGMASTIQTGLQALQQTNPVADGVLLMVCDQPFLTPAIINDLISLQQQTQLPAAACRYQQKTGTPALFHQSLFKELMLLQGDTGARKILEALNTQVALLNFEKGMVDVDTEADYQQLINPHADNT